MNPVIIGIRFGKFGARSGLSSLYSMFLNYAIHAQLFQRAVESMQEYLAQYTREKDITLLKDTQ